MISCISVFMIQGQQWTETYGINKTQISHISFPCFSSSKSEGFLKISILQQR